MHTFFAYKTGMIAKYTPEGAFAGATQLTIPNLKVVGQRTVEKNGYTAAIAEITTTKNKKITREIRQDAPTDGEVVWTEFIKPGDLVNITGVSNGKGFIGVVKRYKFAGGPRTHGQSDRERAPGSSASGTRQGHLYKGKRMAGRMGQDTIKMRNLQVLEIDSEKRLLTVKGSVPGNRKTLLTVESL